MDRYDPDQTRDPAQWLALAEEQRISLVEKYHRSAGVKLPNVKAHAVFHVIVENQLAEGLEPVVPAVARLVNEGLRRHDAVHAIGSVLAEHLPDQFNANVDERHSQAIYNAAVERLTAREWLKNYGG